VSLALDFGFYPRPIDIQSGHVTISTLPDLDAMVAGVTDEDGIDDDWI
jgi:hypothetical protein